MTLSPMIVEDIVRHALREDLGHGYDLTSQFVVDGAAEAGAKIVAKEDFIVAGLAPALTAFALTDPDIGADIHKVDGEVAESGDVILDIGGPAQAILTAERTALNFLAYLSGVASITHQFVSQIEDTNAKIVCIRKTMPGMRALQHDAVRSGGGYNHRFGLDNGILIKDNHIALAGSISEALDNAKKKAGPMVKIEIEVEDKKQVQEVLKNGKADAILLDNMSVSDIAESMTIIDGELVTEASGNVSLETVRAIAETGVDYISIGALTHSARFVNVGLDVHPLSES